MNAKVVVFLALVALAAAAMEDGKQQKRDLFGFGYPGALGYPYNAYNPYTSYNPYGLNGLGYNPYTALPSRLASPWAPAVAPLAPWGAAALATPAYATPAYASPLVATTRPAAYLG
ncbi:uncharacterized protein LOC135939483 [Cloeon dipterum]|uniref:uncharacterized protein LOC135939483 n=1 Tax=Cloeon dipterum TaxID=197152 RepID=UPI00322024AB